MKIQRYTALVVLTIVLTSSVITRMGTIALAQEADNVPLEIDAPIPVYPNEAWEKSPEGMVTVKFDITDKGYVENAYIYNASLPGKFELYALQAIKDHRFEPPDGSPQHTKGVSKNFFFTLDSSPKNPVRVKYPKSAMEQGPEGYVVVRFGVSAWGDVRDQEVVGAEPAGLFEAAALDAASKMKFARHFKPDQKIMHKFTFSLNSEPSKAVVAEFPAAAKDQQLQGHVVVEFDINEDGEVENPEAIYSDASVFEKTAIAAVSEFRFEPNSPNEGVLHKVEFNLNQDYQPLSKVEPEYPKEALLNSIEGYVVVRFDIDETGSVANPKVSTAKPPNLFDESALTAVAQFKYLPKYVDGYPTPVKNRYVRIMYEMAEEDNKSSGRTLDEQPSSAQARYPMHRHSLKPTHRLYIAGNQEDGSVIVEFDVNDRGFVEQPNIFEVQGTRLTEKITQRILDEVGFYRYTSFTINDIPVGVYGVRHRIELRFLEN
ncbi:MAG: TonB family protein [Gammaproteobacteria bacterium]|nr:TonB family protein [Gammaproteobacteria bacterium]MYF02293.1 TonB family protein [Gammaproteobacteria bacterium]